MERIQYQLNVVQRQVHYFFDDEMQKSLQKTFFFVAMVIEAFGVCSCVITANIPAAAWNGATFLGWLYLYNKSDEFLLIGAIQALFNQAVRIQAEVREGVAGQRDLIERLNTTIRTLRERNRELEEQAGRIEELVERREGLQRDYEAQVREHRRGIEELMGILEGYEERKARLKGEIDRAKEEHRKIQASIQLALDELRQVSTQLGQKTEELTRIIHDLQQGRNHHD